MPTVACPGCGLPRVESEVGAKPCPVCDAPPVAASTSSQGKAKTAEPDPTAGLPSDVSELYNSNAPLPVRASMRPTEADSRVIAIGSVAFLLGALFGVGGVLGYQAIEWSKPKPEEQEVAAKPTDKLTAPPVQRPIELPKPPVEIAVAPMPHEAGSKTITIDANHDFVLPDPPPPPGVVVTYNINLPDGVHSVPSMKKGEHIVLKGKVKTLRIRGLDDGAIIDASKLEASVIIVSGKVDGSSTLKLNAPKGTIHVSHKIDAKSVVELNAPDGEVNFMVTTTTNRDGAKIDNGSAVSITARVVEFRGDIGGTGTKVSVILTRNGWMQFANITDQALVEYKAQVAESQPQVIVGSVARTATLRKVE